VLAQGRSQVQERQRVGTSALLLALVRPSALLSLQLAPDAQLLE